MSRSSMSYKQAQVMLQYAAGAFAMPIRGALELWLHIVDELPHQAQTPYIAAATDLVQAALQQAPRPYVRSEPKQVAWLQQHLTGISIAMKTCISSQLEVSAKRVSILESLTTAKGHGTDEHQQARLKTELTSVTVLEILALAYLLMPVETLCTNLACATQAGPDDDDSKPARSKQQQRLQLGNELIRKVASSLKHTLALRDQVQDRRAEIYARLKSMGVSMMNAPRELINKIYSMYELVSLASIFWLQLLSRLPPAHKGAMSFFGHVDWTLLEICVRRNPTFDAMLKPILCEVFITGGGDLLLQLARKEPQLVRALMHYMGWRQDKGSGADDPNQLSAGSSSRSHLPSDCVYDRQQTTASAHSKVQALNADPHARPTCAAGDGDDLNDMHALLRLMYGCTVKGGQCK